MASVFQLAPETVDEIQTHVTTHQNNLIGRANETRDKAANVISGIAASLAAIRPGGIKEPIPPRFPKAQDSRISLSSLGADSFGKISPINGTGFAVSTIGDVSKEDIRDFDPVFNNLTIPEAPTPRPEPRFPDAPVFDAIVLPNKPNTGARPTMPDLV